MTIPYAVEIISGFELLNSYMNKTDYETLSNNKR